MSDRCRECGHFITAPGKKNTQTFKSSSQKWERPAGTGPLTQTWPTPRAKGATRTRLEQAVAVGVCCAACVLPAFPVHAAGVLLAVTSSTYVLSVALGKDNQKALFKLLDRNGDGKLNIDDIVGKTVDKTLDRVLEPDESQAPAPQSTTDRVEYGFAVDRMMPDGTLVRAVLSPDFPRYVTKERLKQCARLYFELDGNENFSQRQCGAPFGDDLGQVQDELERLEYIAKQGKAKNAPRTWTDVGQRWLEKWLN